MRTERISRTKPIAKSRNFSTESALHCSCKSTSTNKCHKQQSYRNKVSGLEIMEFCPGDVKAADHYATLGIQLEGSSLSGVQRVICLASLSVDEIKDHYRKSIELAAGNVFQLAKISQAWTVLSGTERKMYDLKMMQQTASVSWLWLTNGYAAVQVPLLCKSVQKSAVRIWMHPVPYTLYGAAGSVFTARHRNDTTSTTTSWNGTCSATFASATRPASVRFRAWRWHGAGQGFGWGWGLQEQECCRIQATFEVHLLIQLRQTDSKVCFQDLWRQRTGI